MKKKKNNQQQQNNPSSGGTPPGKRPCKFCDKDAKYIDYKDYPSMKPFVDYFGNIRQKYYTGTCLRHQKMLRTAIERARFMGMLAYRK